MVNRRDFLKLTGATGAGLLVGLRQFHLARAGQLTLHVLSTPEWQRCDVFRGVHDAVGEFVGVGDFSADFHSHESGQVDGQMVLLLNGVENRFSVKQLESIRFDEPTGSVWTGKGLSIRGNDRVQTTFTLVMTSPFSPSDNDPPTPIFDIVGGCVYEPTGPPGLQTYTFTGMDVRHFFSERRG